MAGYLTKPITQPELWDAILAALAAPAASGRRPSLVTRHALRESRRHLHILLAEDNLINQKVAAGMLEMQSHTVVVVGDGRQAVAALEREAFDLVLMDVQMPEMDGFEATTRIRERERGTGRHVPIIALTAHAMKGDREKCLQAGMDGYVTKPILAQDLFTTIAKVLQEFEGHTCPAGPAGQCPICIRRLTSPRCSSRPVS